MKDINSKSVSSTETSSEVCFDKITRVVNIVIIASLVGTVCYVFDFISILRIKVSMVLILLSLMEAVMALPITVLAGSKNLPLYRFIATFDTIIGVFLVIVAISFSSSVSFVRSLWIIGAVSNGVYYSTLGTVALSWVGFFFHVFILLKWLHAYGKIISSITITYNHEDNV